MDAEEKMRERLHAFVDILKLGNQEQEYRAIKALMAALTLRQKWLTVEVLDYLSNFASMHLCRHLKTTLRDSSEKSQFDPRTRYQYETCSDCGLERLVYTNVIDEGYGQTSEKTGYAKWELPTPPPAVEHGKERG